MSKKTWIKIGIGVAVVVGTLAMIKLIPFWGTLLSLCSYAAGIASYWAVEKYGNTSIETK